MIVWVASFPRSGNTFLRIVLNRLYGVRMSVIYDVDGVAERLGKDFLGFEERPGTFEAMRASDKVHFIKTHAQRDERVDEADLAICLVRDGRDSLVSWARQVTESDPDHFEARLAGMINNSDARGTGSWGNNVLSWLETPASHREVLSYEALITHPRAAVERAVAGVAPDLLQDNEVEIPSFAELQTLDDRFFRRGYVGTHRRELPDHLHELFWSRPDNVAAMQLLNIQR